MMRLTAREPVYPQIAQITPIKKRGPADAGRITRRLAMNQEARIRERHEPEIHLSRIRAS